MLLPDSNKAQPSSPKLTAVGYMEYLEQKTQKLLSELDGVGDCHVAITLDSSFQFQYAYDVKVNREYNDSGGVIREEEQREYCILTVDGNGEPITVKESLPSVIGVAVVCRGANESIKHGIVDIIQTLYNLTAEQISVQID